MSDNVKHITDNEFKKEVTDFWAPWCGPCQMLGPVLEKVADTLKDKIKVVKINTDENQTMASQLGVSGIPALFLFKGGKQVSDMVGFAPQATLEAWVKKNI